MDYRSIDRLERATRFGRRELFRLGCAVLFLAGVMLYAYTRLPTVEHTLLAVAAMIGGYMAINIGANDVANNVGPAVGSRALTLVGAIAIAAIFEAAGALIAGGEVAGTIKKNIIDPTLIPDSNVFVWLMLAALLAGAVWLNLATAMGAPVSTTHSIVGGVLGAGAAAAGLGVVKWKVVAAIVASWVVSPLLGGLIAAAILYLIKRRITYQADMIAAARRMVPWLIAAMAWAFVTYLLLKGFKHVWKFDFFQAIVIGFLAASTIYLFSRPLVEAAAARLENGKESVSQLFTVPLIFAAAFLSFAHGANDVANAVGPLAAINAALSAHEVLTQATIPLWVMAVGALGISLGLALYGPKLIHTVGSEITELDKTRAFCIAMAAALTVLVASQLGLPVSSTHTALGAVFGVGFLREYLKGRHARAIDLIIARHPANNRAELERFLEEYQQAPLEKKKAMLGSLKNLPAEQAHGLDKAERKQLKRVYKEELVRRELFLKIIAAWIITVPFSALLAAMFYFMIRGMMI